MYLSTVYNFMKNISMLSCNHINFYFTFWADVALSKPIYIQDSGFCLYTCKYKLWRHLLKSIILLSLSPLTNISSLLAARSQASYLHFTSLFNLTFSTFVWYNQSRTNVLKWIHSLHTPYRYFPSFIDIPPVSTWFLLFSTTVLSFSVFYG